MRNYSKAPKNHFYKKEYNKEVNTNDYNTVTNTDLYLKRSIQRLEILANFKLNKIQGLLQLNFFKECFIKTQYEILRNYYKNLIE